LGSLWIDQGRDSADSDYRSFIAEYGLDIALLQVDSAIAEHGEAEYWRTIPVL
jgi:hypothetical protein